ncbi:MAG: hypothetical protein ACFE8P_02020, partial [Promethearchaeota archaeon]
VPEKFDSLTTISPNGRSESNIYEQTIAIELPNRYSVYNDFGTVAGKAVNGGSVALEVTGMLVQPHDGQVYFSSDKDAFKRRGGRAAKMDGYYFYCDSDSNGFYETVYVLAPYPEIDSEGRNVYTVVSIGYNYDGSHDFAPYEKIKAKSTEVETDFYDKLGTETITYDGFTSNWKFHYGKLERIDLLFPRDDHDGYVVKDHVFEIHKLAKMDGSRHRQLFYEIKHEIYESDWVRYRQQFVRDVVEQVFMTLVATAVSSNIILITLGLGIGWGHVMYLASYSLMSKFFMDLKAAEQKARERAFTYLPSDGSSSATTTLSERAFADRLWGDSMIAALSGHPGAYYATAKGGSPGSEYEGAVIVSPPNDARMKASWEVAGNNAMFYLTLNPDYMIQLDFDEINLDYFMLTSELPAFNSFGSTELKTTLLELSSGLNYVYHDSSHSEHRFNTVGYLQKAVTEASGGELNAIVATCVDGRPQYRFVDGTDDLYS